MKQKLVNYINSIQDPALRLACDAIGHYPIFLTWPASLSFHHAYEGGLLAHTVEVCDYALHIASAFSINRDVLVASALWHDVLKVKEYRVTGLPQDGRYLYKASGEYWVKSNSGHDHIIHGAIEFASVARGCGVSAEIADAVIHCLLSHHGPVRDWGSPIEPKSIEAIILHQADYLSAKFGHTK